MNKRILQQLTLFYIALTPAINSIFGCFKQFHLRSVAEILIRQDTVPEWMSGTVTARLVLVLTMGSCTYSRYFESKITLNSRKKSEQ